MTYPLPTDEPSDAELVRQAKAGALEAFEMLTVRYEQKVFSLAMRILHQQEDAEDVTQQTFLSVLKNLQGFREESSFSTWLLRITTHAALKVIRKRDGLETVPLDSGASETETESAIPHPVYIADWRQSPEETVGRNEIRRLLDEALASLDPKHRLVFLLRDVEGLSISETALALGISEANTKVRLLRARLQLRERLTQALGDPSTRIFRGHHHDQEDGQHHTVA